MPRTERAPGIYECRSCDRFRVGRPEMRCCGEPMAEVDGIVGIEPPELDRVMREVFGMASTELDVCRLLVDAGEATVRELTSELDRDRSVVTRHLNHLVELGVVEKDSESLDGGGRVNVYSPATVERIRRQFELGLYTWLLGAVDAVDGLTREKIETMGQRGAGSEAPDVERSAVGRLLDLRRFL